MLKHLLPRTIFFRYLLIIIAPVLLLQIILTIVFFDSLWIKTNKGLARTLAGQINSLVEVYSNPKTNKDFNFVKNIFENKLISKIYVLENYKLPSLKKPKIYNLYDQLLDEQLASQINAPFWYDTKNSNDFVDIRVSTNKTILQFIVEKSRIRNSSARIFILWITIPSILFLLISILFLRNQIKPFTSLAESAEKFGKGQYVPELKPSGAVEVRKVIIEFEKMKRRILRHISQRTAMLSGISHDLKTPLTRLKLQIEILNKNHALDKVKSDVLEMEKMIAEYLDFSSSQETGNTIQFDLSNLMTEIKQKYNNNKITFKCNEKILMLGRKHLIKRCLYNLIDNSIKYAGNADIVVKRNNSTIEISIEDDGPGVPENERERVMRPFYRIDKSRQMADGSVGLGLSIVQDIVNSHGGTIKLTDNPKGKGLKVILNFPA
jgi:two-component system, OmpR family, osmolarity sensor histidine kinase EnvZ